MRQTTASRTGHRSPAPAAPRTGGPAPVSPAWSFVYVFFSNGIPFDAPNRSEPCPAR